MDANEHTLVRKGSIFARSKCISLEHKPPHNNDFDAGLEGVSLTRVMAEGSNGDVQISPSLAGEIISIVPGSPVVFCKASFLAGLPAISAAEFNQSAESFSAEKLAVSSGNETLLLSSFGKCRKLDVDGNCLVSPDYLIAFQGDIHLSKDKDTEKYVNLAKLEGQGHVWLQSFSTVSFAQALGRVLPLRTR